VQSPQLFRTALFAAAVLEACSSSSPDPAALGGRDGGLALDSVAAQVADVPAGPPPTDFAAGAGVLMRGFDERRTGATLEEKHLSPAVVQSGSFGKLYCRTVDDEIYASILYVPQVGLGAPGKHDLVVVATMADSIYAFDALTGEGGSLWEKHYARPGEGITPVPTADLARTSCRPAYKDISHSVGIVSTPAIDPATQTLFLVARTKEQDRYFQRLHAISLVDGSERPGSPVEIVATGPGTGAGSNGGTISFDPLKQNQRAALLLHDGILYITWASHCDAGPYHGWILGYDAATLRQAVVFNTTPGGADGGIWMSGQGPSVDEDGNLYIITGNGTADLAGGLNRGQSFVKLRREGGTLSIIDWFTPFNYAVLEREDRDLGSTGALLIPGTHLVVGGSKEGKLYVLDGMKMGQYQAEDDGQIVQTVSLTGASRAHNHGTPVYWKSAAGEFIYAMAEEDYLKQFRLVDGKLQLYRMSALHAPIETGVRPGGYTMPGGFLTLAADADRSGVVWVSTSLSKDANQAVVPGILRAFDASDVSKELWNSEQNPRDAVGAFAKFNPPTVYNGRVYMPTFSGQYCVYASPP
jgi:hypothetical protein